MTLFIKQRLFELFLGSLCYFALIEQNWYAQNLISPIFIAFSTLSILGSILIHNDKGFLQKVADGLKVKTKPSKIWSISFDFVVLMFLWGHGLGITGLFWFIGCLFGFSARSKIDEHLTTPTSKNNVETND